MRRGLTLAHAAWQRRGQPYVHFGKVLELLRLELAEPAPLRRIGANNPEPDLFLESRSRDTEASLQTTFPCEEIPRTRAGSILAGIGRPRARCVHLLAGRAVPFRFVSFSRNFQSPSKAK